MSKPSIWADPAVGFNRPQSMLIVVVFPAPLGPKNPNISPLRISRFRPLTAVTSLSQTLPLTSVSYPQDGISVITQKCYSGGYW